MLNTTICQGHGGRCACSYNGYDDCVHVAMGIDLGVTSYCDGTCAEALDILERDIETGRAGMPEDTTDTITLQVSGHGRTLESYTVTFEGPDAERWAVAYVAARPSLYFSELLARAFSHAAFPDLADTLYPTCEHGMSAALCEGPYHFMTRDQEMARGW